jgi:hypothetical protein
MVTTISRSHGDFYISIPYAKGGIVKQPDPESRRDRGTAPKRSD